MKLRTLCLLAGKEMRDARRNRWFLTVSCLFAVLSVSLSGLGLAGLGTLSISGFGRTAASLLNLVVLIVPLMGLLLGAMSLAGEREQGTLITLLAQPVTPSEVFLGKYLGSAAALLSTLLIGFGSSALVIARYAGGQDIQEYVKLVGCTALLSLVFLSAGFLVSVCARRQATAVGSALFIWFAAVFLSDLGLMGTAIILKLTPAALFWMVLANPAQAFKLAAVGTIQKTWESLGPAGLYAVDRLGDWLMPLLAGVLAAWLLGSLIFGAILFGRRCAD